MWLKEEVNGTYKVGESRGIIRRVAIVWEVKEFWVNIIEWTRGVRKSIF
jgi:hypothetical protein